MQRRTSQPGPLLKVLALKLEQMGNSSDCRLDLEVKNKRGGLNLNDLLETHVLEETGTWGAARG